MGLIRCPKLRDLPPPPPGKSGWPWTEESPPLADTVEDTGAPWPELTVVTPSYNQGAFLEETVRSVLLQGYPRLEYIIHDGGSTDASVAVIQKYKPWLAHWHSKQDRGQAAAVNSGFERATGSLLAYINADDMYEKGAFAHAGRHFAQRKGEDLLVGAAGVMSESSARLESTKRLREVSLETLVYLWNFLPQPACFWTAGIFRKLGAMHEHLHYALDTEYFLRFWFKGVRPGLMPDQILAFERRHQGQKTQREVDTYDEVARVIGEYFRRDMGGALRNVVKLYLYWRRRHMTRLGWRGAFHKFDSLPERHAWRCFKAETQA